MIDTKNLASIQLHTTGTPERVIPLFKMETKEGSGKTISTHTSVIYGANGSGKSTIGRILQENPPKAAFHTIHGEEIPFTGTSSNIYVYNEDYTLQRFLDISKTELDSIILLGSSAENAEKEAELNSKLAHERRKEESLLEQRKKTDDAIDKQEKAIQKRLSTSDQGVDGSWRQRSRHYHATSMSSVRKEAIERIKKISLSKENGVPDFDTVTAEFNFTITQIQAAKTGQQITWIAPELIFPIDFNSINEAIRLVEIESNKPTNTDSFLELKITEEDLSISTLQNLLETVFNGSRSSCPTCFQEISIEHSHRIQKIINDLIKRHDENLAVQALRSREVIWTSPINLDHLPANMKEHIEAVRSAESEFKKEIEHLNELIRQKSDNPKLNVTINSSELTASYEALVEFVTRLTDTISAHNDNVSKLETLRSRAADLNDQIASLEIRELLQQLTKLKLTLNDITKRCADQQKTIENLELSIQSIQNSRRSDTKAAEEINKLLRLALGHQALQLQAQKNGYRVTNRNTDLPPGHLSTGERNILSLCYFFIEIAKGRELEKAFTENQLIILDDPISSFDQDNKYGVMSLIYWFSEQCLKENSKCKLAIFTHDLSIAYELSRALGNSGSGTTSLELSFSDVKYRSFGTIDFYSAYLRKMLQFAYEANLSHTFDSYQSSLSPNDIRRTWEAFTAFELGENVTNATLSPKVRLLFQERGEKYLRFIEAHPGRSFIHTDSHSRNQILRGNFQLEQSMTPVNYQRFVKEILCIMHVIAPHHIASRLANRADEAKQLIEQLNHLVNEVIENS